MAQGVAHRGKEPSVDQQVARLLSQMTLEEKVGQLRCTMAWNYCERKGDDVVLTPLFDKEVLQEGVGNLWATFRADPWTRRSLENGLGPRLSARAANKMQRAVRDNTRLGIPLLFAEEAPHGHMAIGSTVFPTGLGMAATWDAHLMRRVGDATRRQVRCSRATRAGRAWRNRLARIPC